MSAIYSSLRRAAASVCSYSSRSWKWFRSRKIWQQAAIAAGVVVIIGGGIALATNKGAATEASQVRTVTLESVGSLSGDGSGASIVGSVRSVTQADLLAQTGGTVRRVNTTLGARVRAGYVVAELDNASEAASVLQAEGAYDAAIAARDAQSLPDTRNSARDAYQSAYTSVDTVLENNIDQFFGESTAVGPRLLIRGGVDKDLPRKRQALGVRIDAWGKNVATSATADPATLLDQATADTQAVSSFLLEISTLANETNSGVTPAQVAALAEARATIDGTLAKLAAARAGLRTGTVGATASASASVKSALGILRGAQANYEKTRVRATIGGTINYLPVTVGSYVAAFSKVATVANNGSLEIIANAPEESRDALAVGMQVMIEGTHKGTITAISPALNPTTKQIEVRIAVDATPDLVNGQSVRITLPGEAAPVAKPATATASSSAPVLLPLTSVKLLPESRAVFTVGTDGRIVAHTVTIGDVVGDRIQVLSGVSSDMRIVTDVRGLSEGQKVQIGEATSS